MEKNKQEVVTYPTALPIVQHRLIRYFADLRLGQFRDMENPHNFIEFDSEQGGLICRQTGVISCPECGTSAIVSPALDREKLRCVRCFSLIVPLFDI
ncbi:MAG: hypothetical protein ABIG61_01765 [Planctomycetota bacterium]